MFFGFFDQSPIAEARKRAFESFLQVFDKNRLERFLTLRLEKSLQRISIDSDLDTIVFKVIDRADKDGWFNSLLEKAKDEFPQNDTFRGECDKILALLRHELPADQQVRRGLLPSPRNVILFRVRRVNLILAVVSLAAFTLWGGLTLGWLVVWWALGAIGGWLGTNVLQFFLESAKLRRIDQILNVVLDSRRTTYLLGGLLVVGLVTSLFVGAVQAPPKDDELPVRIARLDDDHRGRCLAAGDVRLFPTTLWFRREVTVWADGYEPRPVEIWPWWRQRLRADNEFELAPYFLIAADNQLAPGIHNKHPWKLEIQVNDKTPKLIEYYGEFVLLGDPDHQPDWIKKRLDSADPKLSESHKKTQSLRGGEPTLLGPPVLLASGDRVKVRLWKWVDESAGKFRYERQAEILVPPVASPGNKQEALSILLLPEPKPD